MANNMVKFQRGLQEVYDRTAHFLYYLTYAARAYAPGQYWLEVWQEGISKAPMYLEDGIDVHGEELPKLAKDI